MDELMFLAKAGQFELLESLCLCTCTTLLHPPKRPSPQTVTVSVRKPDILAPLTVPSVSMCATADRLPWPIEQALEGGGALAIIVDTDTVRVQQLKLPPHVEWEPERPACAFEIGVPLSTEDRKRPVLRRVRTLGARETETTWLVVTRKDS